ncbi:zf-HC2 domain-containing protein [bacterium]|nr:zf-HC2 domain-containing protein [candidate division CSSED10-310 bacterium]
MTCRQFRDRLDEYMDNEVNETVRQSLEDHARECPDCKVILQERRRLFHWMMVAAEPAEERDLTDSIMNEIRMLPIPHTLNPMRKPLFIAVVVALIVSGVLMLAGLSVLPDTVSPVDVFKLMAGSIDLPDGLRASIGEMGAFLNACWVIIRVMIHVTVTVVRFLVFRIPVVIPLIGIGALSLLGIWLVRRQRRNESSFGIWL